MNLNKFVIFLFVSFSMISKVSAQTDNLRINIYHDIYDDTPCFQITVLSKLDTVHSQKVRYEDEILIDSLEIGKYSVNITNCGVESDEVVQSITKIVEIKPYQLAALNFDFAQYVNVTDVDTLTLNEIIRSRTELQLSASYFDFRWNPDDNNPKFNAGFSYSGYHWNSFSKHFGFLIGGGIDFMFAPLRIDSTSNFIDQKEIKSTYYSNINGQFDVKFRFSTLNQQSSIMRGHSIFIDIGALYNLPFYFKRVTRFNFQDKIVNSFIHHYTDARFYVNVGFMNIQLFASYRPFDFIRGDYPELPRFNTGLKVNVNYSNANRSPYGPAGLH